jgi:NAD(P)-dependent dehydrogenase (short-subunit alcohol dehydrogenase family)
MSFAIDLHDSTVLVTGGTGGIGLAVVEAMLTAGAHVAFCAVDQAECERALTSLRASHPADRMLGIAADLRERQSLVDLVAAVNGAWGGVDTLVCNAADFGEPGPVLELDLDVYARVLQANVANNFLLCREVLPAMLLRGSGSVILMTSITGYAAMPTNIPYASSKAAIASMARSLAAEYAGSGIRVNCVSPGLIRTEASRAIWDDPAVGPAYVFDKIPAQRIGEPDEVAALCVFLASDLSRYITAATLPVDGGRLGIGQHAGTRNRPDDTP